MTKFHDFDPLAMLQDCQRLAQTAFNNTQELARAHNQQDNLVVELVRQHNELITLYKKTQSKLDALHRELEELRLQLREKQ